MRVKSGKNYSCSLVYNLAEGMNVMEVDALLMKLPRRKDGPRCKPLVDGTLFYNPKPIIMDILKFQDEIYATNVEKGFWIDGRSQGEAVALICSELYEAVEAHRKGRRAFLGNSVGFALSVEATLNRIYDEDMLAWSSTFLQHVKDSIEDEIADAAIRILDCCKGWNWNITIGKEYNKPSTGNFAHDILRINWYVIKAFHYSQAVQSALEYAREQKLPEPDLNSQDQVTWYYVMRSIEALCSWYQVDLKQHVSWKIRFNKSRPHKHGKSY